jgi:tRNA (uracil-5-)-methyltransferase
MTSIHSIKPDQYEQQLQHKEDGIKRLFADLQPPELAVFTSPVSHYRMRCEFKIWHEGDRIFFAMHEPGSPKGTKPTLMREFPVASRLINAAMPRMLELIESDTILKHRLFQVEFLSTTTDELLITLIYHKPLDEAWQQAAKNFAQELQQAIDVPLAKIDIIGRSRKQKLVLGRDYVIEQLRVNGRAYAYQQIENSFTQPNAAVCEKMLQWACDQATHGGDLLELYCGNGNFTLPLAQKFDRVFATEISKTSVNSAKYNCELNNCSNIQVARLSSEEFTEAYTGVRPFRRLADIDLANYSFSTVFVDPPRAGLDEHTCNLVNGFDHILYISCNPQTLKRDLGTLLSRHQIAAFALFDQFPYTEHAECGVYLTPRS